MTTQTTALPRANAIGAATHQFLTQLVRVLRWHEFPFQDVHDGTVLVPNSKVCINDPWRAIERLSNIIRKEYAFPELIGRAFQYLDTGPKKFRVSETGGYHHECPHGSGSVSSGHPWFQTLSNLAEEVGTKPDSSYYAYPCLLPGRLDSKKRQTWSPYVATTICSPWGRCVAYLNESDYTGIRSVENEASCVYHPVLSVQTFTQFNQLAVQKCCSQWADNNVIARNREPWQAHGGIPLWPPLNIDCCPGCTLRDIGRASSELGAYRECFKFSWQCRDIKKLMKKVSEVAGRKSMPLEGEYVAFPFELRMKLMRLITDTVREEYLEDQQISAELQQRRLDEAAGKENDEKSTDNG